METLSQEDFALRVFFNRQLCRLLGLCLFGFIFFCFASLCDWNILDPSFSHATNRPVTNIMGYWGAVFSDLAIQLYGLSSVVFLIPLIFWAKNLIFGYSIRRPIRRFFYWFFSSFLLAGLAALIPVPFHWPLPTGLGGVFGDTLIKPLTILIDNFNISKNFYLLISTLFLFLPGIFLFIASLDLRDFSPSISNNKVDENEEFDDLIEDERKSFSFIGYLMHAWLFLRAFLRRYVRKLLGLEKNKAHAFMKEPKAFYSSSFSEDKVEPQFFETPANQDFRSSKDFFLQEKFEGGDSLISQNDIEMPLPSMDTLMKDFCSDPSFSKGQPKSSAMVYSKRSENKKFEFPPLTFLAEAKASLRDPSVSKEALQKNARILEGILEDFGVKGEIIHVKAGPVVTLYELEPAPGIKSSRVIGLADDIARSMSAVACRVAVVSGRNAIGIELPNLKRETVYLREILSSPDFRNAKSGLPLALGKTINGDSVVGDITRMPHVLVAGTTGSGKSVAINTMILSLVYKFTPQECRLIMIDPKMLELSVYEGIPHLLTPVVTDPQKALAALKWTVREMENRYCKMSKVGVRNIDGFNTRVAQAEKNGERIDRTVQTGFDKETGKAIYETETLQLKKMPYIVVIIDEMADLMMVAGKDIEGAVQRLAQMARAAGIHVIMATQRPSVDVITGTIKANFPTRISFQVTSKIDSRTILGEQGAEQLLGMGDMLYMAGGGRIQRVHGPFVSDSEVEKVVQHLKLQGTPEYLDDVTLEDGDDKEKDEEYGYSQDPEDPYTLALDVVSRDGKVSTSYIQRRLGIGYNRAASIIERMEKEGIIGKPNHAGKREILIPIEKDRM